MKVQKHYNCSEGIAQTRSVNIQSSLLCPGM